MKTRLFPIVGVIVMSIGISILVLGIIAFNEISKAMEEYPSSPLHTPGSSVPYPAYDQAEYYFGISGVFFAAGGSLLVIWKKRK